MSVCYLEEVEEAGLHGVGVEVDLDLGLLGGAVVELEDVPAELLVPRPQRLLLVVVECEDREVVALLEVLDQLQRVLLFLLHRCRCLLRGILGTWVLRSLLRT